MKKYLFLFIAAVIFIHSLTGVYAATADLAVRQSDIRFSKDIFVAGDTVRVYATIRNEGDVDMSGYVSFYLGADLIESSQVITVVAGGENEEVWADFTVPNNSFNINVVLKGIEPEDENTKNNSALTPLYPVVIDTDYDGVADDNDNCPENANADQIDTDEDGVGDVCDNDDDNDGLSDDFESELGTNPLEPDSDADGVSDAQDYYPQDPEKTVKEEETDKEIKTKEESAEEKNQDSANETDYQNTIKKIAQEAAKNLENTSDTDDKNDKQENQEITLSAKLETSTKASFVYFAKNWRLYEFESLAPEGTYRSLIWDFGDGSGDDKETVEHKFPAPGKYTVTLKVVDNDGNTETDSQVIEISFFHLQNPLLRLTLITVGVLIVIAGASVIIAGKKNKLF
ncbi:PKD domain-containing protein [Candidatus Parcubacteria bacterium]|nr:MAG: PKD domain-containing protein [Candidatus Parcubacteria bacterium]